MLLLYTDVPPGELTETLVADLTRSGAKADDVCVLAIRRSGPGSSATVAEHVFRVG
jgi:hypothetical protein